jgi:hypothetical protein
VPASAASSEGGGSATAAGGPASAAGTRQTAEDRAWEELGNQILGIDQYFQVARPTVCGGDGKVICPLCPGFTDKRRRNHAGDGLGLKYF